MNQNSNHVSQQHQWLGQVMKAEQTILDGQMLPIEQLLAIPADIRMKSPLLLRAECENGLLNGRLMETKQRLEAALRGFAAQADESAMLAMMAMLALLYVQVGDQHEARPFLTLLAQEWERNPEHCSGFVPWALARASANTADQASGFDAARALLLAAAERFREEGRPLWTSFVLLDCMLFDPWEQSSPDWLFWMNWLKRHTAEHPWASAVVQLLVSDQPNRQICEELPVRYAYLSKAVLLDQAEEQLPTELVDDIESSIYAALAAIRRQLADGRLEAANETYRRLDRWRGLVSTPAIERLVGELQGRFASVSESGAISSYSTRTESESKHGPEQGHELTGAQTQMQALAQNVKWTIKLFDGIGFSIEDGLLSELVWKRRKAGELFVYLLLQPGYKSNREQVIERVFGEGDLAKRSNQLYVTLHDLRSALKDIVQFEEAVYAKRGVIGISEQIVEAVDVETFMTLSRVGDQLWMDDREAAGRLYDKALPLYGILGTELPHAEWLQRAREQLLTRQTTMLKRLAALYSEQNDEAREEQKVSEWIALRPDQDEAYEAMIRLCLRSGRRVEAIGWYRRLERICKEERGTEPLDEVKKLLWN